MRILVGVDGSPGSIRALEWAWDFASRTGAEIHSHVTWFYPFVMQPPLPVLPHQMAANARDAVATALESTLIPVDDINLTVGEASAGAGLVEEARRVDADLVVVGTRGHGALKRVVLGSVSRYVCSHSPVPVVVVPPDAKVGPLETVAVGVDGSPNSIAALQWAVGLQAEVIDVVHCWNVRVFFNVPLLPKEFFRDAASALLDETILAAGDDENDPRVRPVLARGDTRTALVERSDDASLLVVGQRGHSLPVTAMLGSVAHYLAAHAKCPVVVVPKEA